MSPDHESAEHPGPHDLMDTRSPAPETLLTELGLAESEDGMWTDDDGHTGAVLTRIGVFVGWIDVIWPTTLPARLLKGVSHVPSELSDDNRPAAITRALDEARRHRQAAVRRCKYCGEFVMPGHMHEKTTCMGCAVRHLGVVY